MATEESRITHLAGIEEVDVLLPYLAAVLVLADMREGEFVCLLDCFARARIRIEASARDYNEILVIAKGVATRTSRIRGRTSIGRPMARASGNARITIPRCGRSQG